MVAVFHLDGKLHRKWPLMYCATVSLAILESRVLLAALGHLVKLLLKNRKCASLPSEVGRGALRPQMATDPTPAAAVGAEGGLLPNARGHACHGCPGHHVPVAHQPHSEDFPPLPLAITTLLSVATVR